MTKREIRYYIVKKIGEITIYRTRNLAQCIFPRAITALKMQDVQRDASAKDCAMFG